MVVRVLLSAPPVTRLSALLCFAALAGCDAYTGGTEGERGVFSFYEPNTYPDDETFSAQGFELPIALGARVDVWTTSPSISTFAGAEIDDPNVLSIESTTYPIVLRARSVGTATLRVELVDGAFDTLPLTVVEPDGARVWIDEPSPLFGPSDAALGTGYALRPGASLEVAAQPRAGRQPLLGFDVFEWTFDETLLEVHAGGGSVNTFWLEALGVTGETTVSTQWGGEIAVATLAADEPLTLTLRALAEDLRSLSEIDAIGPTNLEWLYLSANDAAGRLVRASPSDRAGLSVTVTDGTVVVLEATLATHALRLRACAGTGTIEIAYLGARLTVPIEVTAETEDETCP